MTIELESDLTAAVTQALIANCVDSQDGIHSWRCEYPPLNGKCGCLAETVADVIAAAQPIIVAAVRAQVAAERVDGPFEVEGFMGCTDRNPDVCACGTDTDVVCAVCYEVIEAGERAYSQTDGLPWLDGDDPDQEWETSTWHARCDTRGDVS